MSRVQLCAVADVPPGSMRRFEPEGADPILICNVDGRLRGLEDECTHAIASLAEGRLEDGVIFCPLHGGSFSAETGKAMSLPCKHPLRTFPVEVVDGQVWINLE